MNLKEKFKNFDIKVKSIYANVFYVQNTGTELQCSICQNMFEENCGDCNGLNCKPIKSSCEHYFHFHCVEKWRRDNIDAKCPNCRADLDQQDQSLSGTESNNINNLDQEQIDVDIIIDE